MYLVHDLRQAVPVVRVAHHRHRLRASGNHVDVTRMRLFRSEHRCRRQVVPVVCVVQAARAGAVRAALVTTSM